jgi:hypothetical protein
MSRAWLVLASSVVASLGVSARADAKPKPAGASKNAEALKLEEKARKASVSGDVPGAVRTLDQAIKLCEPANACTSKTKAQLHMSLGAIRGVGEGDYAAAKREFIVALALDPEARLRTLATPELTTAFEEARAATAPKPLPEKPAETTPPDKKVDVGALLHQEEPPPPPPPKKETPDAPSTPADEGRANWLSLRVIADFAYLSDANICSPGAPSNYYCTDEAGARYTGHPQPNDDVSSGFAFSTTRLVLGYERLIFGGLTAGALAGYAFRFAPEAKGRKAFFPLHLEARATYTFGDAPYEDGGPRFHPFVFVAFGAAQVDTHVIIRVNEIPCEARVSPACKRDLNAFRTIGNVFTTLGGGVRVRIEGRHALRAGLRATLMFGEPGFVTSPEVVYELGL